jgi:uncharacterized delta-60 repeat protein
MALQADGKIVVTGRSNAGGDIDFAVARYNTDGSPDNSFDGDGKVTTNFGGNDYGWGLKVHSGGTVQADDDKIVVSGYSNAGGAGNDFAVARYNTDGSPDTSFDGDGRVTTDFGSNNDRGFGVAVQADGRIVVTGWSNAGGTGNDFAVARYVAVDPPSVPQSVSATSGNGSVTMSWAPPVSDGGSAVTGYTVTATPGGQTCTTTGALSCTVTGLSNGTPYTFTVAASNAGGAGPGASTTATPRTIPSAPRSVTVTPGDASMLVTWAAPVSDGGAPIHGHRVTATPGGQTCLTGALSCTITGLTNGTEYTFRVIAANAAGTGPGATATGTPDVVPGAPRDVTVTPGRKSFDVAWSAPTANGGTPITGYTATASPGGRSCTTTGAASCRIAGLDHGTSYTLTVAATNALGVGAASDPTEATVPLWVPSQPRAVTGVPGNRSVTVSWQPPLDNGGTPITRYLVRASGTTRTCHTTGALSCTITRLTNGTPYTLHVRAFNAIGRSRTSTPRITITPTPT